MKVREVAELIEKPFPPEAAEEWDNIGLLIGHGDYEVKKVFLTLDVTPFTVNEAIEFGADMIVSHHPILFSATKRITDNNPEGEMLLKLIENGIAVFAAHTNLDSGVGGLNDSLADIFNLQNAEPVLKNSILGAGLGRIGDLKEPVTALEFAGLAKAKLATTVRLSGDVNKIVKRVAVGSGASDDIIPDAVKMGADLVLTGDCKYHRNQSYVDLGAVVVDAGHFPTEIISMDIFENILKACDLEILKSKNTDIFTYI